MNRRPTAKKGKMKYKLDRTIISLLLGTFVLSGTAAFAAPANDNFASARALTGSLPLTVQASNVGATAEFGEPNHSDVLPMADSGRKSIWFSWTATFTGNVLITTEGSGSQEAEVATTDPYVDTQVGIYTGTSVSALKVVAKKEDSDGVFKHGWTRVSFNAVYGTVYKIAVDGWRGAEGRIQLNLYNNGGVRYKLSTSRTPYTAGTVTLNPAQPLDGYTAGTSVSVSAVPNGTNKFFGWIGIGGSSANPLNVNMYAPRGVIAVFNSDRQIAFQTGTNVVSEWMFNGRTFLASSIVRNGVSAGSGWQLVGSDDLNYDGKKDLLFQHTDTRLAVWFMNGLSYGGVTSLAGGEAAGTGWRFAGSGNFNSAGSPDILLQNNTSGALTVWTMNGATRSAVAPIAKSGAGLRAFAVADFNGDGKGDILLQGTDGKVTLWYMNGTTFVSSAFVAGGAALDSSWRPVGVGDFNKDRKLDIVWQNNDGVLGIWFLNGLTLLEDTVLRGGASAGTAKARAIN